MRQSNQNWVSIKLDEKHEKQALVHGSGTFLTAVGQQLCWLAAACCTTGSGLALSRSSLSKAYDFGSPVHVVVFGIDVEIEPLDDSEETACWKILAGRSVLVTGFPIPSRPNRMTGLESQLGVLSSLIGIRQAVTYRGGYVLKARFQALVPVRREHGAVQWHLVNTYPRKIKWADIDRSCPTRVMGTTRSDLKNLQFSPAYLGWYWNVNNTLGKSLGIFHHVNRREENGVGQLYWLTDIQVLIVSIITT